MMAGVAMADTKFDDALFALNQMEIGDVLMILTLAARA